MTTHKNGGMGGLSLFGGTSRLMSFSQAKEDGAMGIIMAICALDIQSGVVYGPTKRFGAVGVPKKVSAGKSATKTAEKILWEESEKAVGEFNI